MGAVYSCMEQVLLTKTKKVETDEMDDIVVQLEKSLKDIEEGRVRRVR